METGHEDLRRDVGRASENLRDVEAVLAAWDGANVIVLGGGLTHRHFRVEVWKDGSPTQLIALCVGPQYYCGPLHWVDSHVRVRAVPEPDRVPFAEEFELRDDCAGVRLTCEDVHLIEEPAISWRRGPARDG